MPNTIILPEVSLEAFLWNLFIGIVLSSILCIHYSHRAKSKVLRRDLGLVLPVICLTTLLVISVVKSSLALSLGLVGALSIVRFRTPIKEPEELAYIFISIAIGLALGADQREVAGIATLIILILLTVIDRWRFRQEPTIGNILLSLEIPKESGQLEKVLALLGSEPMNLDIRRIDQDEQILSITAVANFQAKETLVKFCSNFESNFTRGKFSIIDDFSFPNE
jgi:hypothetical protein